MTINMGNNLCHAWPELQVVLFDVGGVLVELGGTTEMLAWSQQRLSLEELWHRWLHSPAVRAFESGRCDAQLFARAVLEEFQIASDAERFLESFSRWPTRLYPGTLQLLERIPPRYARALLSNTNELHWSRIRDELGLGASIQHHFASHLTGRVKPDAEAFTHVLATLECPATSVLFLDDNRVNVAAAAALGMRAHWVQGTEQVAVVLEELGVLTQAA
jgi:putative hydrolase of the HAD superfamily